PNENEGWRIPFLNDSPSSSPATGLATGSFFPLAGIGVLLAGGLFLFFRNRNRAGNTPQLKKNDSTPFFEGTLDSLFKGLPGETKSSERPDPQPKKWSSDEGEGEKELRDEIENNPPEKVNFGDLIKHERD
ncbi:MAG: LPXTG cell wall anchor domain-containing protein, partial [archaeon]